MTELPIILLIILLNAVVLVGRERTSYAPSFFETVCFSLSLPVVLVSAVLLAMIGAPLFLGILAGTVIFLNLFLFLSLLSSSGANA